MIEIKCKFSGVSFRGAKIILSERCSSGIVDPLYNVTDEGVIALIKELGAQKKLSISQQSASYDYYVPDLLEDNHEVPLFPGDLLLFSESGKPFCVVGSAVKELFDIVQVP